MQIHHNVSVERKKKLNKKQEKQNQCGCLKQSL